MMDEQNERLQYAIRRAEAALAAKAEMNRGIGTQSERMLHCVLKYYFEPDESLQEVRIGRHIADIYRPQDNRILEIQTRDFGRLRQKLDAFLPEYKVTVIYPIAREKHIFWIDPETGEATGGKKSPKRGTAAEILPEIYRLPDHQTRPGLSFLPVFMDLNEYRLKDGRKSRDGKHGSHRLERIPFRIEEGFLLEMTEDYLAVLEDQLQAPFTVKEFGKALHLRGMSVSKAVKVMERAGAIEHTGSQGKAYIYERTDI